MTKRKSNFPLGLTEGELLGGWVYLAAEFLILPTLITAFCLSIGITSETMMNTVYYVVNFAACSLIFRGLLGRSLTEAGKAPAKFLLTVCLGFGVYSLCSQMVSAAYAALLPDFFNVNDSTLVSMIQESPGLMGLSVVVLTPVAEECLYRGLVFTPLRRRNRAMAYCASVLMFCAIHVVGYIGHYPAGVLALCFAQYIPAGLCLTWAYEHTGSLFAPILIHSAVNLMTLLCYI